MRIAEMVLPLLPMICQCLFHATDLDHVDAVFQPSQSDLIGFTNESLNDIEHKGLETGQRERMLTHQTRSQNLPFNLVEELSFLIPLPLYRSPQLNCWCSTKNLKNEIPIIDYIRFYSADSVAVAGGSRVAPMVLPVRARLMMAKPSRWVVHRGESSNQHGPNQFFVFVTGS